MANCSNDYPSTAVYYEDVSSDLALLIGLCIGSVLTVACISIFVEEIVFIRKHYHDNASTGRKMLVIIGLFPVICTTRMASLFVPTSNLLQNLLSSCYIAVCIFTFISMTISLYGGSERMISILANDKISISTMPCCCCLCWVLKPITMTMKSLRTFELLAIQVMFIRPFLVWIAAVLRTDGQYEPTIDFKKPYIYITIMSAISTMTAVYGMIVIFRASRLHLSLFSLVLKFVPLQSAIILDIFQSLLFNFLADHDIPACLNSFGPRVRASNFNNLLLVLESFILCLIARRGYRILPPKYVLDTQTTESDSKKHYENNMASSVEF